jgi:hypothetical protein
MQDVSGFLKASRKCRKSRDNWYADELLEKVAHIQEHAKNKDITKDEYLKMLYGAIKTINLIKDKIIDEKPIEYLDAVCWDYEINAKDVYYILTTKEHKNYPISFDVLRKKVLKYISVPKLREIFSTNEMIEIFSGINPNTLRNPLTKEYITALNNMVSSEKVKIFKEKYEQKLKHIELIKNRFIKEHNINLKYITDKTAFKIPCDGVICDWHGVAMLHTNHYLLHPIDIFGAETIFADYGLYDCSEYFKSENRDIIELAGTNLCATPIRAILDILFNDIYVLNRYPKKLEHFHDDYMMDEIDYDELFEKIAVLRESFNDSQKVILDEFFEKELKDSKSVYCNEVVYDRKRDGDNYYKLKPHSILLDINCSIGNENKHLTIEQVVKLFDKKVEEFDVFDRYAVNILRTESSKESIDAFVKEHNISNEKLEYIINVEIIYG